ncbi:MAG TPA: hypothetical protein ENG51_23725 [Deltaproteobacteria bacterium]|nr:MAG: hypothetical protein DRG59_01520 [Deltaproteobacteria bacterium]HDM79443.1 hypothetical protein [Deltaproteobacteria bacterium]HEC31764.1 hypothetical protein [Deltaproteobacteria bacterium]
MKRDAIQFEEWRGLYEVMEKIKELAPWEWMNEHDIFGVENPETKELGFVSVMGALGEHYAISVYRGSEGLFGFLSLLDIPPGEPGMFSEYLLEIPQLQASFEDRDMLTARDLKVIKSLGLKYRGRKSWPLFRSFKPGFFPWYLESEEIRFLQYALEQILDVAPRFKEDPLVLEPGREETIMVRVASKKGNNLAWRDEKMKIDPPDPEQINILVNVDIMDAVKKLPPSESEFEIDVFMYPMPVQEKRGDRPFYPYAFMIVDGNSGHVASVELLNPGASLGNMWAEVPNKLVENLEKLKVLPKRILVSSDLLYDLFYPLSEDLGFVLEAWEELPNLDDAKHGLLEFLRMRNT